MKIVTIVGARPQFIKAAAVSHAIERRNVASAPKHVEEVLVHTGQHYDAAMSDVFFEELSIPAPKHHLGVGSAGHGRQTGEMLQKLEPVLLEEAPDVVLVYGDTNSTLAGALAAAKLHQPVVHVEAGLRSGNRRMPEEINRITADHLSTLLFCPTRTAVENLAREGLTKGVRLTGDVMQDILFQGLEFAEKSSRILERLGLKPGGYVLATVHRADNTDITANLEGIVQALSQIAQSGTPVVFPIHPRTRKALDGLAPDAVSGIGITDPAGYRDMVWLERNALMVLTDSGGVQKEAHWLGVPCAILREETEWIETLEAGNRLVGSDPDRIQATFEEIARSGRGPSPARRPERSAADLHVEGLLELGNT